MDPNSSANPRPVSAVILGGGGRDELARQAGVRHKAFVPVGGRPMVAYVLDALLGSPLVASCLFVGDEAGDEDAVLGEAGVRVVPSGGSFAESIRRGVEASVGLEPHRTVLLVTADLPWLDRAAIEDFIGQANGYDIVYPVVKEGVFRRQFGEQPRTFVRLADGRFTGGNPVLVRPAALPVLLPFIDRVHRDRKNPLALVRLLGVRFVWRLLTRRLSIADIVGRLEQELGLSVGVYASPFASLAADIDKPVHLDQLDVTTLPRAATRPGLAAPEAGADSGR